MWLICFGNKLIKSSTGLGHISIIISWKWRYLKFTTQSSWNPPISSTFPQFIFFPSNWPQKISIKLSFLEIFSRDAVLNDEEVGGANSVQEITPRDQKNPQSFGDRVWEKTLELRNFPAKKHNESDVNPKGGAQMERGSKKTTGISSTISHFQLHQSRADKQCVMYT